MASKLTKLLGEFEFERKCYDAETMALDAREAWDAQRFLAALDLYRRMADRAKEAVELAVRGNLAPVYERIARGNFVGMMANASQALALMAHQKAADGSQMPEDERTHLSLLMLKQTFSAYELGLAAYQKNPEWEQYRQNAIRCLRNIQGYLKSRVSDWDSIFLEFEDVPGFLNIMKKTNLRRFMDVEMKRKPREYRSAMLWSTVGLWMLVAIVFVAIGVVVAKSLPWWVIPLVFVFSEVGLLLVGALSLRVTGDLSEAGFLQLVTAALKYQFRLRKDDTGTRGTGSDQSGE